MNFSKEQIEFMKNASDHVEKLCGGRGYGKIHQLIKEMEDKINKLKKENELLKDYKIAYENVMIANRMLEKEWKQLKKQKDDVVEYIKEIKKHREEGLTITEYKTKWRSMFDYLESDEIINNLLRMLGEIDVED